MWGQYLHPVSRVVTYEKTAHVKYWEDLSADQKNKIEYNPANHKLVLVCEGVPYNFLAVGVDFALLHHPELFTFEAFLLISSLVVSLRFRIIVNGSMINSNASMGVWELD